MTKKLKLKIKNTQLRDALKLDKDKLKKNRQAQKEEAPKKPHAMKPKMLNKKPEEPQQPVAPVAKEPVAANEPPKTPSPVKKVPTSALPREVVIKKAAPKKPAAQPEKKEQPAAAEKKEVSKSSFNKNKKGGSFKQLRDFKPRGSFDSRSRSGLNIDEEERWRKKRRKTTKVVSDIPVVRPKNLKIRLPITVKDLASEMKLKASEVMAKLFMHGLTLTINDYLEDEVAVQLIGEDFECEITIDTSEEEKLQVTDKSIEEEIAQSDPKDLEARPPIVAFMGHVDHGKTSLIDAIRSSNRVATEAGAITQHMGAFLCNTSHGPISVLDTPGHEAFSAMRERGAKVTDIIVLVVAGDEGIKEQTIEAIKHAKESGSTIVVAINKADKPSFNPENIYRQLAEHELTPEAWGGQTLTVNCSAVTKQGVDDLIELLGLQSEVLELKATPNRRARGVVIESQMHKGLGAVATLLVQNGTLHLKDAVVFDQTYGRIKTMQDEHGKHITSAKPSIPVKVTGLSSNPKAGSEFIIVGSEKEAKQISQMRSEKRIRTHLKKKPTQELVPGEKIEIKVCNVIVKADVQGSLEALTQALDKIDSNKVSLNIIHSGIGEIAESDVDLAKASQAAIIGFHTRVQPHADPLVKLHKVEVHLFDVIYHVVDQVKELMRLKLDKVEEEKEKGQAEVLAIFKSSQLGLIAGCMVQDGAIHRSDKARVKRDGEVIWQGEIASLKRVKEDVKEVSKGFECGILLKGFKEFQIGDHIEAYEIIYLEPTL